MKRTAIFLAVIAFAVCPAYALWLIAETGTWPKNWPQELEPLRKQSRSLTGGLADQTVYEIPFASREDFESAWPHLLKVKSQGAPVLLVRGPNTWLGGTIGAGVRIHCPPGHPNEPAVPSQPLPGDRPVRERWLWTTFIELVVDGEVVDLNRIPLPADTPIIDERFEGGQKKSLNRSGG